MDHTMLAREEYIEQSYLFRTLGERMLDGVATQEALKSLGQEILATTKLPLAIDYLVSDLKLTGTIDFDGTQPLLYGISNVRHE